MVVYTIALGDMLMLIELVVYVFMGHLPGYFISHLLADPLTEDGVFKFICFNLLFLLCFVSCPAEVLDGKRPRENG